jgi:hypothetical protein
VSSYFDAINAAFQLFGAVATWANVRRLSIQRTVLGVNALSMVFFTVWGIWNVIYYRHTGQLFSFAAGVLLASGNVAWVRLYVKYRRQERKLRQ